MDFRKTFDTIPEEFDKWRPRYCPELFERVISYSQLGPGRSALEIGPGTGQATEPILKTGCDYLAIELGEHFCDFMNKHFGAYDNFHIVNADFETYDFGKRKFDLVYSAATIQWIPEQIAFSRTYELLKPGGVLAMFMTRTDYRTPNPALYDAIQRVYDAHFHVDEHYTCHLDYERAVNYGFEDFHYTEWKQRCVYTAQQYVEYLAATQIEHITLKEPYRSRYFSGIEQAVRDAGGSITLDNTIALYLTRKPASAQK